MVFPESTEGPMHLGITMMVRVSIPHIGLKGTFIMESLIKYLLNRSVKGSLIVRT